MGAPRLQQPTQQVPSGLARLSAVAALAAEADGEDGNSSSSNSEKQVATYANSVNMVRSPSLSRSKSRSRSQSGNQSGSQSGSESERKQGVSNDTGLTSGPPPLQDPNVQGHHPNRMAPPDYGYGASQQVGAVASPARMGPGPTPGPAPGPGPQGAHQRHSQPPMMMYPPTSHAGPAQPHMHGSMGQQAPYMPVPSMMGVQGPNGAQTNVSILR
eukprot:scaffold301_cov243-Pinguiococcus_pyrenoidosus.AAC.30